MKSTIKIDFNDKMKPVIEVKKVLSEDTRDRLLAAWVENLGYNSNIALVEFVTPMPDETGQRLNIRAMGTKEELEFMKNLIERQLEGYPEPTDVNILTKN